MRCLFPSLLLLLAVSPLHAETVSLEQALQQAAAARPFAEASRHEAEAAAAAAGEARSRYWPRLAVSETFTRTNEPATAMFISLNQEDLEVRPDADFYNDPPPRSDFETRFTIQQPLFDPDIAYGRRRTEATAAAAAATARWSEEEAAFAAFRAYLGVQQAQGALDWVRSTLTEAEEIVRLAKERRQEGVGLKADELRARVRLAEAQRLRLSAENDLFLARRHLAQAIGRPHGEIDIAGPIESQRLLPPVITAGQRADLEALRAATAEAELANQQSRAAYLPRLGASAAYALHDDDLPFGTDAASWLVGAGLNWELFDGGERRHARARTAAAARAAAARVREAVTQADLAAEAAGRRAEVARLQLATADQATQEAEESFRLTRERYMAGLVDLAELLATQTALERVRFDRLQAADRYLLALGTARFEQGDFLRSLLPVAKEDAP